jgi:hypothetical protein
MEVLYLWGDFLKEGKAFIDLNSKLFARKDEVRTFSFASVNATVLNAPRLTSRAPSVHFSSA